MYRITRGCRHRKKDPGSIIETYLNREIWYHRRWHILALVRGDTVSQKVGQRPWDVYFAFAQWNCRGPIDTRSMRCRGILLRSSSFFAYRYGIPRPQHGRLRIRDFKYPTKKFDRATIWRSGIHLKKKKNISPDHTTLAWRLSRSLVLKSVKLRARYGIEQSLNILHHQSSCLPPHNFHMPINPTTKSQTHPRNLARWIFPRMPSEICPMMSCRPLIWLSSKGDRFQLTSIAGYQRRCQFSWSRRDNNTHGSRSAS